MSRFRAFRFPTMMSAGVAAALTASAFAVPVLFEAMPAQAKVHGKVHAKARDQKEERRESRREARLAARSHARAQEHAHRKNRNDGESKTSDASDAKLLAEAPPSPPVDCATATDVLGTSRVLTVEPGEYQRLGSMQYPQTLPLNDHEVVITFDDGPLPPSSKHVLDILASQCVKVTYFLVGSMAHYFPSVAQRMYADGHTIGTHSETHPLRFDRLSTDKLRYEIDQGVANVAAALGDPNKVAPFFRIPGLGRSDAVERELAARGLVVFSTDVVADDWFRGIKPGEIVRRAITRLEARGKGILLLHDIHPHTAEALPGLLKELKDKGFHVVHIVPGAGGRVEMVSLPTPAAGAMPDWAADKPHPDWPKTAATTPAQHVVLPAPAADSFDTAYGPWRSILAADGGSDAANAKAADTQAAAWPNVPAESEAATAAEAAELPAPSVQDFGVPTDLPVVAEAAATSHD
jgi:peptidoglycan-N-acetylglucosamine deacetylase